MNSSKVLRGVAQALLAPLIAVVVSMAVTSIVVVVAGASVGDFWNVIFKVPSHRNLVNINDLSVQSATGAHQTSAASAELSRLAVDLNGLVARFRT